MPKKIFFVINEVSETAAKPFAVTTTVHIETRKVRKLTKQIEKATRKGLFFS